MAYSDSSSLSRDQTAEDPFNTTAQYINAWKVFKVLINHIPATWESTAKMCPFSRCPRQNEVSKHWVINAMTTQTGLGRGLILRRDDSSVKRIYSILNQ